MHKFERFIIYPLLFVALFYAMTGGAGTDTLANPLDSEIEDVIRARNVVIYNEDNEEIGILGVAGGSGGLKLYNSRGNEIIGLGSSQPGGHGVISVLNKDGVLLNSIASTGGGKYGGFSILNDRGDELIYLGPSGPDDRGTGEGHGLINIYDKYGEDYRSYTGYR